MYDPDDIDIEQGDSASLLSTVPDNSVSVVATDPPYGMGFQSNRAKGGPRHKKIENDDKVHADWLVDAYRVLEEDGALITFCDWRTSPQWHLAIEKAGFDIKSQIVWDRGVHGMGDLKGAFAPQHDIIYYATKGRRTFKGKRPKSVIRVMRPSTAKDHGHPTCKPVELMRELIGAVADEGTVLDPFMGSGSTGVACVELGLFFIGFELDEVYFETAKERIEDAVKKA